MRRFFDLLAQHARRSTAAHWTARFAGRWSLLLVALLSVVIAQFSWQSWRQQKVDTAGELATVVELGERALDVYFTQLETALGTLARALEETRELGELDRAHRRAATTELVGRFLDFHPELTNVAVVRADGEMLVVSGVATPGKPHSLIDDQSFKAFREGKPHGVEIGRPHLGHQGEAWIVPVRYGIYGSDGELRYLIGGTLPVEFFSSFWKNAPIVERATIGLIRDDGYLLSRYPIPPGISYADVFGTPRAGGLFQYLRHNRFPINGSVEGAMGLGGEEAIFRFHRLSRYPLTLFSARPLSEVRAVWWDKVKVTYLLAAILLIVGFAGYSIATRRRSRYEKSLRKALIASVEANRKLDIALNSMAHGLCMFDSENRLIVRNARYLELFGLSPEEVELGSTLRDILHTLAKFDIVSGDPEPYMARILSALARGETIQSYRELRGGRTILVTNRPLPGGGWVATHEDITPQRQYENSLKAALLAAEQASTNLDVAVNNMSHGLSMFGPDERIVVVNDQYVRMYGLPADIVKPGCTLMELFRLRHAMGQLPRKPEQYREELKAQIKAGKTINRLVKTTDGREIAIVNRPMRGGGWVAIHEDVTERNEADRKLEETQRFLNIIIENAPVPIVVKEPDTKRFVLVNRAYEKMIGKDRAEIIGKTAHELFPLQRARNIAELDDEVIRSDGKILKRELIYQPPGKPRLFFTATGFVVRSVDGVPQHLISVIEDATARKQSEEQIAHMAHHDALTDLPNRVLMRERLAEALTRASNEQPVAVLYLDLDRFKSVNDTLGHSYGDELLKETARRLRTCAGENELVARLGGDEFAIVQPVTGQPSDAAALARRIRDAITLPYQLGDHQVLVDVSIGIAIAPKDTGDLDELLKSADMALYGAKADGRGTFRFFEPDMDARMRARRELETDLRKALANNELELYYQPLIDLERNEFSGCEALLRWRHPTRGMISPAEFIPIAEEAGLIIQIGDWVLRAACAAATAWPDGIKVAVNVSPVQFRDQTFALAVVSALGRSGLPAHRLEIEVTEAILMQDDKSTLATLHQLRDLGVHVALDDFGTGYSSLSYLRSFPFDKIKIDRSFISDLSGEDDDVAIVQAVVTLARSLNMATTAEGVETQAQLEKVRAVGCTEAQGYLFAVPVPETELLPLLAGKPRAVAG
jgi:diguanylate cyclase (GGDEF)-like protein/PAS domain S-box-containing protein